MNYTPSSHSFKGSPIERDIFCLNTPAPHEFKTKKAQSVQKFFNAHQISSQPFTQPDVEALYRMMEAHPLSNCISFYTLFTMEFQTLLEELNSLDKFLSPEHRQRLIATWEEQFIVFSLCKKSGSTNFYDIVDGMKINVIEHFYKQMEEHLKTTLKNNQSSKSPVIQRLLQKNYDNKILPYLKKWAITLNLLEKFLSHDESRRLLHVSPLFNTLGIQEAMPLSTPSDGLQAGMQFCKLGAFIKQSLMNCDNKLPDHILSFILPALENLDPQIFAVSEPSKKLLLWCEQRYIFIETALDDLENKVENVPPEVGQAYVFARLLLKEMKDVLKVTIIPLINPLDNLQKSHECRMFLNFSNIATKLHMGIEQFLTKRELHQHPLELQTIYRDFLTKLNELYTSKVPAWGQKAGVAPKKGSSDHLLTLTEFYSEMVRCFEKMLPPRYLFKPQFHHLSKALRNLTEDTIQKLSSYAEKHPQEMHQLPLLRITKELAITLVMIHDLDIVLEGESPWPCEWPISYLDLIALTTESAPPTETVPEEPVSVHLPFQEEETKKPAQAASSKKPPKPVTPPAQKSTKVNVNDLGLGRGIEAIQAARRLVAARIGLSSIEGARHTRIEDKKGNLVTVVPRHGTLAPGTLNSIKKSVDTYLSGEKQKPRKKK